MGLGTHDVVTGELVNRPNYGLAGRLFIASNTLGIYYDTGTSWEQIAGLDGVDGVQPETLLDLIAWLARRVLFLEQAMDIDDPDDITFRPDGTDLLEADDGDDIA